MTSTHEQTQAHQYGMCDCDNPLPAVEMPPAPSWATADEDVDEDNGDRPVRRTGRSVEARRRARRRF